MTPRNIELLAPARDADTGVEAIRHGADAVYIGGPGFGARAAAGNSVADIERLAAYAHLFGARVYVAFNTILYDDELEQAREMAWQLYRAGADALIVQDLGLLELDLPPIALHASTQMDNRTPGKVRFLADAGFEQVVLARELTLDEIRAIHAATPVALEVFVHGALCVSLSGQCYASQYCFGRSANRGECAQFCRLAFDLVDAEGRTVVRQKHLLSLRDMNRTADLEAMLDAGVSSLKIEGRLKDTAYVKNVTAHYRQQLDAILRRRPDDYRRASLGESRFSFSPAPAKSFNRGFTDYFLHGRTADMSSFDTPKATGEPVGRVREIRGRALRTDGAAEFANGDGLCFVDSDGQLRGFRVNRVADGWLYPAEMPHGLRRGTPLFRNADQAFERLLARPSAERRLALDLCLSETDEGYALALSDEGGRSVRLSFPAEKQDARTPQRDQLVAQLSKLGQTPYAARRVDLDLRGERFIPASLLGAWRREAVEALMRQPVAVRPRSRKERGEPLYPERRLTYLGNVANARARHYYAAHGVSEADPAYELAPPAGAVLMTCRYCLRYALGVCPVRQGRRASWREPLALRLPDGRRFPLSFDCQRCLMKVHAPE